MKNTASKLLLAFITLLLSTQSAFAAASSYAPYLLIKPSAQSELPQSRRATSGNNIFSTDGGAASTYTTQAFPRTNLSSITTLTATSNTVQSCSASGGAFAVTLPAASAATDKLLVLLKNDSSANAVTVTAAGSDTIGVKAAATVPLSIQGQFIILQSDGSSNWIVIGTNSFSFMTGWKWSTQSSSFSAVQGNFYSVTATATVTLPTAVGCAGQEILVLNNSTNTLTFNTTSSQTISGQASGVLTSITQYDVFRFVSDGSNWLLAKGGGSSGSGGFSAVTSESSSFSAVVGNAYKVTATATCTLPTAVGVAGQEIFVQFAASSGTLTFNTTSSQTMDGVASGALSTTIQYQNYRFMSDGANWMIE